MAKFIQLNINYDPEYPHGYQQEDPLFSAPEPWFPYKAGGVSVLGLKFRRKHVVTKGFDPYDGDKWTLKIGKPRGRLGELKLVLSSVVSYGIELDYTKYGDDRRLARIPALYKRLYCAYGDRLPWLWRKLWDFLDYRWAWYSYNEDVVDVWAHYYE